MIFALFPLAFVCMCACAASQHLLCFNWRQPGMHAMMSVCMYDMCVVAVFLQRLCCCYRYNMQEVSLAVVGSAG